MLTDILETPPNTVPADLNSTGPLNIAENQPIAQSVNSPRPIRASNFDLPLGHVRTEIIPCFRWMPMVCSGRPPFSTTKPTRRLTPSEYRLKTNTMPRGRELTVTLLDLYEPVMIKILSKVLLTICLIQCKEVLHSQFIEP